MDYTFRTMILPAEHVPMAQALAEGVSGPAGSGMWTTGLSASGEEPATHYVSTGMIGIEFAAMLVDADALYAACQSVGAPITLEQCQALVSAADVSEEQPFDAFARMGLKMASGISDQPPNEEDEENGNAP